jgi:hypothetical protein
MADFKLDTSELTKAFEEYRQATQKDMADILNRAGKNVAFKAIRYTPSASKESVRTGLDIDVTYKDGHDVLLKYLVVNAFLKKHGQKAVGGKEMGVAASNFMKGRMKTIGYIKAGWLNAALDFGATLSKRPYPKGFAAKGYGKKASPLNLNAALANFATGANLVGVAGLQRAIDETARDMIDYAQKKMQATAQKHSA